MYVCVAKYESGWRRASKVARPTNCKGASSAALLVGCMGFRTGAGGKCREARYQDMCESSTLGYRVEGWKMTADAVVEEGQAVDEHEAELVDVEKGSSHGLSAGGAQASRAV